MGGLFTRSKRNYESDHVRNARISEKDRAVLELKRMRDRLRRYREGLVNIVDREAQLARELIDSNQRKRAVLVLKKKKLQESLAEKAQGQLYNIETMLTQIETAALNQQIYQAMKVGQATLSQLQSEMSLDDIEELMQDTVESVHMQQKLSDSLATSLTPEENSSVEAEVERMLAEMQAAEETVPDVITSNSVVSPVSKPVEHKQDQKLDTEVTAAATTVTQDETTLLQDVAQLPVPQTEPPKVVVTDDVAKPIETSPSETTQEAKKEVVLG